MHEIPAFPEISWGKQHAARKQCLIFARNFIITFLASDTEMCTLPSVTGPLPRCYYQAGGAGGLMFSPAADAKAAGGKQMCLAL